ncbi:hypothetical protein AUJ14_04640 [Candidatus Micrarchaeota archaeon CG1_02_55_22]|nr:MAG: hypothetical protein AUJ14_04640 [Candidatus Micrarchaeota archaeon CG1_02_55_22]
MSQDEIMEAIDWFAKNYDTRIITVNGRGNPFHPLLKEETLLKIHHAGKLGMKAYVFTASDNLDEELCKELADTGTNVMISLYGNKFIDAGFFSGKEYAPAPAKGLQDEAAIANRLRLLTKAYKESSNQPPEGTTRLAMNYVVGESDLRDESKLRDLSTAASENNVFFVCNTPFVRNKSLEIQNALEELAAQYTHFHLSHSTAVDGQCQMGAGASATVDYNGALYRCPYFAGGGDGNFLELSDAQRRTIVGKYLNDRNYACVMRRTPLKQLMGIKGLQSN